MTNLQKNLLTCGFIISTVFVASDVLAMTDGANGLTAAWKESNLEQIIGQDLRKISAIIGIGVCGVMAALPKTPKLEIIGGTFAGIVGTGFLLNWVQSAWTIVL